MWQIYGTRARVKGWGKSWKSSSGLSESLWVKYIFNSYACELTTGSIWDGHLSALCIEANRVTYACRLLFSFSPEISSFICGTVAVCLTQQHHLGIVRSGLTTTLQQYWTNIEALSEKTKSSLPPPRITSPVFFVKAGDETTRDEHIFRYITFFTHHHQQRYTNR